MNNAGFDGHSRFGHIVLLKQAVVPLRPDVALFLVGANDPATGDRNRFDARMDPSQSWWTRATASVAEYSEIVAVAQNLLRVQRARWQGLGDTALPLEQRPRTFLDDAVIARARRCRCEHAAGVRGAP